MTFTFHPVSSVKFDMYSTLISFHECQVSGIVYFEGRKIYSNTLP